MARTRTSRIPKAQKVPIVWELSDEVTSAATTLMGRFEVHFADLRQFRIAYLMVVGGREPKRDRIDGVWAGFNKQTPMQKALHGYDIAVWVRGTVWKLLDAKQREALVAHALSHGTTNDKGELVIQRHDTEEFAFVVRNWGPWHENVALFGKQLSLFGKPDDKPANGDDAFADIDAKVADQKAEGNITPIRPRSEKPTEQPGATS